MTANRTHPRLKQALARHGITYDAVAARAGVSWWMVYAVLNGRRTSAKILTAAAALLEETKATT